MGAIPQTNKHSQGSSSVFLGRYFFRIGFRSLPQFEPELEVALEEMLDNIEVDA